MGSVSQKRPTAKNMALWCYPAQKFQDALHTRQSDALYAVTNTTAAYLPKTVFPAVISLSRGQQSFQAVVLVFPSVVGSNQLSE